MLERLAGRTARRRLRDYPTVDAGDSVSCDLPGFLARLERAAK